MEIKTKCRMMGICKKHDVVGMCDKHCHFNTVRVETNYDLFTRMSQEELAKWLSQHLAVRPEYEENKKRTAFWLEWLKQGVSE